MLKVYIAASMNQIQTVRQYAQELRDNNIVCTSRWRTEDTSVPLPEPGAMRDAWCCTLAQRDIEDIERADVVVCLTSVPSSTGGLWVELGYCIASKKLVLLTGPYSANPFEYLPAVRRVRDWPAALELLKSYKQKTHCPTCKSEFTNIRGRLSGNALDFSCRDYFCQDSWHTT